MTRQYELKLLDEPAPAEAAKGRRAPEFRGGRALATIIDVEPDERPLSAKRAKPSKAKPAFLPPDCTAEDAFRLTLTQCKWHIAANVTPVVEGREVEGMHQLRVGLRRLRVALSSFGGEFRTPAIERLRLRAKKIAVRLATARDLDVFLQELFEPAANANGSADAFAVLRARARTLQKRGWDEAIACVLSPSFANFMSDLSGALDACTWREGRYGGGHAAGIIAFEMPATSLAKRMLAHRLAQAKKRARRLETLSDASRHQLRIALKKLRYSAEFFAPLYAAGATDPFIKRLSGMQDVLGTLQDVVVARTTLERLVENHDDTEEPSQAALSFAAGMVYGWHLEYAAHTWEKAVKRWKKFVKAEPFWAADALD